MIPVVWASNHADVLARGTWDQGMLEALFDRSLWRVPGGFDMTHHEVRGEHSHPAGEGAVVVISGRNHASRADVGWLNRNLARLVWVLLIVTGDEEAAFPYADLLLPDRSAVWGMGVKEPHPMVDRPLGSGWPPWYRELLPVEPPEKDLDFVFAGQVTHARREEAAEEMRIWAGSCELIETAGFTQGLPHDEYASLLARAKVAPCPSGPESPDSFRVYEALEAGCVPLADAATPHGPEPAYWTHVLGESPPFPEVHDWSEFSALMNEVDWPADANRIFAWWQEWKRDLAWRFTETVIRLADVGRSLRVDEEITVIIPTSPTPIHPSIDHIAEVIESVRAQLPDAEILIGADGVRPEQRKLADDYDEYLRRLTWACNRRWSNVVPIIRESWGHQANTTRMLLDRVRTPLVLFVEHDTPVLGEIPWDAFSLAIHVGAANVVRLAHEASILPEHAHLMPDGQPALLAAVDGGVQGTRTIQWSQRPHLAAAWWYREMIDHYFDSTSRTMIEDVLHGVVQADARTDGWERWRLWIYTPPGDIKRSWHLDSRGDAKKYEMRYRYPGRARPAGAPPETPLEAW